MRTEEEVDQMIEEMTNRVKGNYITQAVAFNKTCPRQMGLLKKALMSSISFSGLAKELLAMKVEGETNYSTTYTVSPAPKNVEHEVENAPPKQTNKNITSFL